MDFQTWRHELAEREAVLRPFLDKLDRFFENERFKAVDFERAVENGLLEAANAGQIDIEGSRNG